MNFYFYIRCGNKIQINNSNNHTAICFLCKWQILYCSICHEIIFVDIFTKFQCRQFRTDKCIMNLKRTGYFFRCFQIKNISLFHLFTVVYFFFVCIIKFYFFTGIVIKDAGLFHC